MYSGQQKLPSTRTPPVPPPPDDRPPNGTWAALGVSTRAGPVVTFSPVDAFFVEDLSTGFSTGLGVGFGFNSGVGATISGVLVAGVRTAAVFGAASSWTARAAIDVIPPVSWPGTPPMEMVIGTTRSAGSLRNQPGGST